MTSHVSNITGAYDEEESAARAYDLAALKYWGTSTFTNFPVWWLVITCEIMVCIFAKILGIYLMFFIPSTDIRLWERDTNNADNDQRGVLGHFEEVNTCDPLLL